MSPGEQENATSVMQMCLQKLKAFIEDSDQNCKNFNKSLFKKRDNLK
jgi:hypothetical protein